MLHSTLVVFKVHLGTFRQSKILFPFSLAIQFFFFFFKSCFRILLKPIQKPCSWALPVCRAVSGNVSPKTDVFAFGVVLYELISAKQAIVTTNETITQSKGLVALVVFFFFFLPFTVYDTYMHSWNYFIYNWLGCTCCFVPVWRSSQTAGSKRKSSQTCWS